MNPRALLATTGWLLLGAACASDVRETPPTTMAGFDEAARLDAELLASRARCTACHAAEHAERIAPEEAPRLDRIGARKTPEGLRRWLSDPHGSKPGTAMPDLLAALPEAEREATLEALVHYLAAQGGPLEPQAQGVDLGTLEDGRRLFHTVGCVACHAPQESLDDLASATWEFDADQALAPSLVADLGAPAFDTSVEALAQFLLDPLAVRPSGRMPSLHLSADESRAIATYLLRGQCDSSQPAWAPGWEVETFEFEAAPPDFAKLAPTRRGAVARLLDLEPPRESLYGFRIRGFVEVPASGSVDFVTRSDDGVRLYVDDELRIDEWHDQSPAYHSTTLHLDAGRHALELHYFQNLGGADLDLLWGLESGIQTPIPAESVAHSGLRFEPEPSTFRLDTALVERGRVEFARLGCGACHAIEGREARTAPLRPPTLAAIHSKLDQGCLSATPRRGAPHFDFGERERRELRTLLLDDASLGLARTDEDALHATMTRLSCYACHRRGDEGGPDAQRSPYFQPTKEVDLGDEGRLPPHLDGVGAKLKLEYVAELLKSGRGARPYLATRMPVFGERNVAGLAERFAHVDRGVAEAATPQFGANDIEFGRRLAGAHGLGCIQCHSFNGVESLGIPAVDLGVVTQRIQRDWFQRLLLDPRSVGMNSRMPILWQTDARGQPTSPVKDILEGDPRQQIDALWSYLSLGASMPLPEGLDTPDAEYELHPSDGPLMCAVFLEGASPRGMMVGFPEGVHYAYDIEHSRIVWIWRGRFFNAKGTWFARAGHLERPPVDDAYKPAERAPFAVRKSADEPWPANLSSQPGYRRLGWRVDAEGVPIWRYEVDGIVVEERTAALVEEGHAALRTEYTLRSPTEREDLYGGPVSRLGWLREGDSFVARTIVQVNR